MTCTKLAFLKTCGGLKSTGRMTFDVLESVVAPASAKETKLKSAVVMAKGFMMTA